MRYTLKIETWFIASTVAASAAGNNTQHHFVLVSTAEVHLPLQHHHYPLPLQHHRIAHYRRRIPVHLEGRPGLLVLVPVQSTDPDLDFAVGRYHEQRQKRLLGC